MDAAIDLLAKSATLNLGIKHTIPVRAHLVGVGVFDLRWNERVRIMAPPGDQVVSVWAKMIRNPRQGLSHAVVQLQPGQSVALQWRMPGSLVGTGAMSVTPGDPPVGYAQPVDVDPPPALGTRKVSPPHEVGPLVPLPDAPPPVAPARPDPTGAAPPPAWHPDPTGRHPYRWWGGARWTDAVSDGTTTTSDPVPGL